MQDRNKTLESIGLQEKSKSSIHNQQQEILLVAINNYLRWRHNKSVPDDRGYTVKAFTWLRHYTAFGENRAINLKNALSSLRMPNPIQLLQNHFKKHSKINNHSLDTYLLESILKNKHLFLIPSQFNSLNTISLRIEVRKIILKQKIHAPAEYAYMIAISYHNDTSVKDHLQKACDYYALAVRHDHVASREALNILATAGNSEAQYVLGVEYYRKNEFNEAINWCMHAAEQGNPKAIAYLLEAKLSVEHYLMIARKYEQGDGFKKNITSAITFYEKASALNSKDAAFRLGQLSQECDKNDQKAFYYYLIAAKQKDETALEIMIKIAEHYNDDKLRFVLAQLYLDVFGDHSFALAYFKKLADRQCKDAINQLNALSKKNPKYAYIIAKLYEDDPGVDHHLQKACVYYSLKVQGELDVSVKESTKKQLNNILNSEQITAKELTNMGKMYHEASGGITKDYAMAKQCFEKACEKGCEMAHYNLGLMYQRAHGVEKNIITAIRYYQLADNKGYGLAKKLIDDLLNSNEIRPNELNIIASMYYSGSDGMPKNYSRALMFYQRASHLGDKSAALCLGQIYQIEHDGIQKNINLAFQAYLQAAKLGDHEALIPLERLGDELSAENQLALSQLYGSFFKNKEKENYWQMKATEVTRFKTKIK